MRQTLTPERLKRISLSLKLSLCVLGLVTAGAIAQPGESVFR